MCFFMVESLLAKKEVAAHTRLTEMTESSVPSYSGYQLVLREQGAGPRDLKPRAHPELCSVTIIPSVQMGLNWDTRVFQSECH